MKKAITRSGPRRIRLVGATTIALILLMLGMTSSAFSQLSGTYTVGAGQTYTTIDLAISALTTNGVSGPVTFSIASGTYTPGTNGYTLPLVTGMSATNKVTFKPAVGATVTISGATGSYSTYSVFNFAGGKYYVIDGSNVVGGTSKDMTIRQTEANYQGTIWFKNDADFNTVKNCNLQAAALYGTVSYGSGIIFFGQSTAASGNDSNVIDNNTIGDPTATYRSNYAIYCYGASSTYQNIGNKISNNDVINFGNGTATSQTFGIYHYYYNKGTIIANNKFHMTVAHPGYFIYAMYLYSTTGGGNITLDGNKFYDLTANPAQYGYQYLYFYSYNSDAASTLNITNNFLMCNTPGSVYLYSWYINGTESVNFYHNSTYFGGTAAGTQVNYMMYKTSSGTTFNHKNNIYYSTRQGSATTCYGIYCSNTTGWNSTNSNYNQINFNTTNVTGTGIYYTGYYSGARQTLALWQSSGAEGASSFGGVPQFVNQDAGDLHISTTRRTPVESRGTPIAAVTKDVDGDTRNGTTPDVGADEGSFLGLLTADVSPDRFVTPGPNSVRLGSTLFTPQGVVYNGGLNSQSSIPVRMTIKNAANTIVYNDLQTIGSLASLTTVQVNFGQTGNVSGTTSLPVGVYTLEFRTELATDLDMTNDTIRTTVTLKDPMSGIYTINPLGSGIRNYVSFTAALGDLNFLGAVGAVTFQVSGGTYDDTREVYPLKIIAAPGVNATNTVTFKPVPGANVYLTTTSANPIVEMNTADYFTFDGSNVVNGTSRNFKMHSTGGGSAIKLINGATYNTFKNLYLLGNSASSNGGIINIANSTSTYGIGNSYNVIAANTIGDSAALIRSYTAIYANGDYSYPNTANRIDGNYIINMGTLNGYGYGVFSANYNNAVQIVRNTITLTTIVGIPNIYGIYAIYYSNGYSTGSDTIAYNTIKDIRTTYDYSYQYAMLVYYYGYNTGTMSVSNNMITLTSINYNYLYGMYLYLGNSPATVNVDHNSVDLRGYTLSSYSSYGVYFNNYGTLNLRNNVLVNERSWTGGSSGYYNNVIWAYNYRTFNSNRNVLFNKGTGTEIGYYNGYQATMANWQTASGQDANSYNIEPPFIDAVNGNLHIDPCLIFKGEGTGQALGYANDYDGEARSQIAPDMGADEGNFNGDGIRVIYPNGGEQLTTDYTITAQYTTNRPMGVRIEMSTNSGANWAVMGTVNPTAPGLNNFSFTAPDTVVSTALVRVVSLVNSCEMDPSDAPFRLVRPEFTVMMPNGGERLVPTDTTQITWSSKFVPPTLKAQLDLSTNGGTTWQPIAANLTSNNDPAVNSYDWIIPNTPTTNALIRVKLMGNNINDKSDAVFTIVPQPKVTIVSPNGGEEWFIGETDTIRWTAVTTEYVGLDYSTNAGGTWITIASRLPAFLGKLAWTIPNTPSESTLVRITDKTRVRFTDNSDAFFKILKSDIQVIAPNGGEKFNLSEPVTVSWTSQNATKLQLEYSSNNGSSWQMINNNIAAALGSYTFTPVEIPTKTALVRVSNADRPTVFDVSDMPFEIQSDRSIIVYTPSTGDKLVRGTVTQITWEAPRVDQVNILYSSNGGASWQSVASGVVSATGSYQWPVPNANTTQGKIRIQEVGGPTVGESGIFSIIDPLQPTLTVIEPNGGETYTEGTQINVMWTSADVTKVSLYFSTNSGTNWTLISSGITASLGQYQWTAPSMPGTHYQVRVVSTNPAVSDASNGDFTIERLKKPSLLVLSPNGGEQLTVDSTTMLRWSMTDITGNLKLAYSVDNGATWVDIATVPSTSPTPGQYNWVVPNAITKMALIRVQTEDGLTSDVSDNVFEITRRALGPIRVVSPNGGEWWRASEQNPITWTAPEEVTKVNIDLSTDGGANWMSIATDVASLGSVTNQYVWMVPDFPSNTNAALVRVRNSANAGHSDFSDAVFKITNVAGGVDFGAVTGVSMTLAGNYPNPFAAQTEIRWVQGSGSKVELRVYRQDGAVVGTYDLGFRGNGTQGYVLDAQNLASGGYIYELRAGGNVQRGVMMLVR